MLSLLDYACRAVRTKNSMTPLAKAALIVFALFVAWIVVVSATALVRGHFHEIYRSHLGESRRERLFLGSLAFFLTFGAVRMITYSIRAGMARSMTSSRVADVISTTWFGVSCSC